MDRTRSKWGRFRPWLAAGAPLLMLATWMLALVAMPYLAWWSGAHRPAEPRSPREIASHHAALGID